MSRPAGKTELEQCLERAASLPQIPTDEATVLAIVDELKHADSAAALEGIAARIQESVFLTYEMDQKTKFTRAIMDAKRRLKLGWAGAGSAAANKVSEDSKAYLAAEVHRAFQPAPPVPSPNASPVQLTFVDVTGEHKDFAADDVWAPEAVEASLDEPFDAAFYRFRAQANPKYRHPYLPTVAFHAVRSGSLVRIGQSGDSMTVAAHLATQDGRTQVTYVHSDDDKHTAQAAWTHSPELRKPVLQRLLPASFAAPAHWLDPAPPPSAALPTRPEACWLPVPTLAMPAHSRLPLPSTSTPSLISRTICIPVRTWPTSPEPSTSVIIEQAADVCLPADRLVPPLTVEQATSLLGRMVQWSDLEPGQETYRTNYQSRELGYAWGFDPEDMKLYCLTRHGLAGTAYVLDMSETAQSAHDYTRPRAERGPKKDHFARPPWGLRARLVQWVGVVSLPGDRDARQIIEGGSVDKQRREEQERTAYRAFLERTKAAIDVLNRTPEAAIFQIGKGGLLLVGDIAACRQLRDFTTVPLLRPGIWRSAFTFKPQDGGPDAGRVKSVRLWFVREGEVDYARLVELRPEPEPEPAVSEQPAQPWEKLCTLSVDGGSCALLSPTVLSPGSSSSDPAPGSAPEARGFLAPEHVPLDVVLEALADGWGEEMYLRARAVPGGIVCPSGPGDGGYHVLGRRDAEGRVREVMLDFWEDVLGAQQGQAPAVTAGTTEVQAGSGSLQPTAEQMSLFAAAKARHTS